MASRVDTRTVADQAAVDAALRWFVDTFVVKEMRERALMKLPKKDRSDALHALGRWIDPDKSTESHQDDFMDVVGIVIENQHAFHGTLGEASEGEECCLFIADDRSLALCIRELHGAVLCRPGRR